MVPSTMTGYLLSIALKFSLDSILMNRINIWTRGQQATLQ